MGKYKQRGGIYPVMVDGTQAKDKHGRLRWIVQVYSPKIGKLLTRRVSGTKRDAKDVLLELQNEVNSGLDLTARDMTLNDFVPRWIESLENSGCREKTVYWCKRQIQYVTEQIGEKPLKDIDAMTISGVFNSLKNDKSRNNGKGLSGTTLNQIYKQTKRLFELAIDYDIIAKNPCRAKGPKRDKPNRRSLTPEEYANLITYLHEKEQDEIAALTAKEERMDKLGKNEQRYRVCGISNLSALVATRIALDTGCRRGEVLALTWNDVEFGPSPKITINKSLTPELEIKEPKTEKSNRTVAISLETAQHIKQLQRIQAEYLPSVIGREISSDDPVCCGDCGTWYFPRNFSRWWNRFRKDAGIPDLKFHELRHSVGSLLIANGLDVESVRKRLGHASSVTTLEFYVHDVDEDAGREAADIMSGIARPTSKERGGEFRVVRYA